MNANEQNLKNKQRFNRLRISFWVLCFFWIAIYLLANLSGNTSSSPSLFWALMVVGFISGWTYLITLGQLASQANKSVFLWVIAAFIFPFFGSIICYVRMRGIAIEKGWF